MYICSILWYTWQPSSETNFFLLSAIDWATCPDWNSGGKPFLPTLKKWWKVNPRHSPITEKKRIRDQTPPHCGDTTGAYFGNAIILFWTPDHPATFRNEIIKNIEAFPKVPIALKTLKKMPKSCGAQLMEVPLVKHREPNRKSVDTWLIELPML